MHIQTDEQIERFGPGGGGEDLALDRLGLEEYLTFHGVCFPFYVCVSYQTLGLGTPTSVVAQSPFPENRHRFSSHGEPYCLGSVPRPSLHCLNKHESQFERIHLN